MKRITAAAALAVAALSVSGCTVGTSTQNAAETLPSSTPAPATATSAPASADAAAGVELTGATPELQAWVEKKHEKWVKTYTDTKPSSADSVYIYMDEDAVTRTAEEKDLEKAWVDNLEWKAPRCGEIVITVKGNGWNQENLNSVGGLVLVGLAHSSPEVQAVTTVTEDGATKDVSIRTDDDYLSEGGNPGGTCDA